MGETIARNKKALFDYEILEKYEAGIQLQGSEVKAIRKGRVNLKDSFVKILKGEPFLIGAHISHLESVNSHFAPTERRDRKLLLHAKEIAKLDAKVNKDGLTIVALSVYLSDKNLVKLQIALAKGKALHDKREALKKKDAEREAKVAIKNRDYQ
ncbi:MAG: SsrA-binding protein SmpB [Sulfurospirillaceae bacterium]|nr:SsrA-binding protein SmpB [Sulfurospirillaceae bacterium]MDD3463773.1 SsrA-binding protein SmpB [Sulfurospirillaceae bacterium]